MVLNLVILHQLEELKVECFLIMQMQISIQILLNLGLDRLVNLDADINFIGKEALIKIKKDGIKRKQVGLELDCEPLNGPNTTFWSINKDDKIIGKVTSAVYSPRLKKNIALAMIGIDHSK